MLVISIVNLLLSIFGITVSSIFILFWCGRFFCARFFTTRLPSSRNLFFLGTAHSRGVAENNSVGVSPLVIAYFPTITFHQDTFLPRQDAMCSVCLGEYKEEELLRMLPQCGHNFHATCIDAWLHRHATCPVCRMSLQGYFVGRSLLARRPPPPITASSQPMSSARDEPAAGANSRSSSVHSDGSSLGMPPTRSSWLPGEALQHDIPTICSNCGSPGSDRPDPCESLQAQTTRLSEHRIDVGSASVERG